MSVFRFVLLALSAYRLTRLLVSDSWPPVAWFRDKVEYRMGPDSAWYELVTCPWCAGTYITFAVFAIDHYLWTPPFWLLACVAAMAIVGQIGQRD